MSGPSVIQDRILAHCGRFCISGETDPESVCPEGGQFEPGGVVEPEWAGADCPIPDTGCRSHRKGASAPAREGGDQPSLRNRAVSWNAS